MQGTIFDNRQVNKQSYFFEYSNILIPINFNTELTIVIWERLYEMYG